MRKKKELTCQKLERKPNRRLMYILSGNYPHYALVRKEKQLQKTHKTMKLASAGEGSNFISAKNMKLNENKTQRLESFG